MVHTSNPDKLYFFIMGGGDSNNCFKFEFDPGDSAYFTSSNPSSRSACTGIKVLLHVLIHCKSTERARSVYTTQTAFILRVTITPPIPTIYWATNLFNPKGIPRSCPYRTFLAYVAFKINVTTEFGFFALMHYFWGKMCFHSEHSSPITKTAFELCIDMTQVWTLL